MRIDRARARASYWRRHLLLAAAAVVAVAGCSSPPSKVGIEGRPPPNDTGNIIGGDVLPAVAPPSTSTATPTGPADHFSDGTFEVLRDVQAGTYRTAGPRAGGFPFCFWYRLNGLGGTLQEIIASGESEGPVTLTVRPSDKAVRTEYCDPWVRIGDAP
ncbi:MAG: hypothetical protein ACRDSP_14025 [Pseudonocardiaceae bacterium]